jgi:hypothetical protein
MADIKASHADGSGASKLLRDMGDGTHAEVMAAEATGNITGKFREAFEAYDPVAGGKWMETKTAGDLVFVDGNAVAASYLVISKDPLTAGTETAVEIDPSLHFHLPTEIAIGLSMSQRTLGQEFAVEAVDTGGPLADIPDIAISSITQTTTVLTIDTVSPHGLSVGKSIGVAGCSNPVANYPALVVASVPSPTQITCTAGPGGTIASQSITNPTGAKGSIYFRQRFGRARNGVSQIFENATVTNASLYVRSESGDALPSGTVAGSHSVTVGTTAPIQLVNSAYSYAFGPTTEFRLLLQSDRIQWADSAVDATAQMTSRLVRTQVCPDPADVYKLRFRATNNKALTVPSAQIVSATKAGSTTATIVTATAHGLALGDPVVIYGIRDQTATSFPNLLTATAVASVVDATTFTIVQGTSGTVTSYGGYVAKVNGGALMSALGASAIVAQSAVLSTLSDGTRQLVLTGNGSWTGLSIGDMTELVGCRANLTGVSLGVDGPWKVANVVTTALTLVLPYAGQRTLPADFASADCGGGVIKRTCMRVSFVRVFDYERLRVEALARPASDAAAAMPVAVQNTVPVSGSVTATVASTTITGGQAAHDAAIAGNPMRAGGRAVTANYAAVATGDTADYISTLVGAQIVKPYAIPEAEWSYTGALTTTSDVAAQTAAGAGLKRFPTWIQATNTGAAAVDVLLRDGTTTRLQITIPAGQSVDSALPTSIPLTANTALNVALSAVGTVRVNLLGYTAP